MTGEIWEPRPCNSGSQESPLIYEKALSDHRLRLRSLIGEFRGRSRRGLAVERQCWDRAADLLEAALDTTNYKEVSGG